MKRALSGLGSVLLLFTAACGSGEQKPQGNLFESDHFLNIAHRGGRKLAPEATLPAFANAVQVGADVLELDVHATSDGVLVCMHDGDVDRTTDGSGLIKHMTFDEIRALDAAYHFSQDGGQTFPLRGAGVQVPSLDEVLDAHLDQHFFMEIKQVDPPIIDPVLDAIRSRDLREQVLLASAFDNVTLEIREKEPLGYTGYAAAEMITFVTMSAEDAAAYQPPTRFIQLPADSINEELMPRIERFDLKAHPWTVNDADQMRRLIELDVAGIITDDPALLESIIEDSGMN